MAATPVQFRLDGESAGIDASPGNRIVVCACRGLTYGTIRRTVASGLSTLDALQESTGAGTECGICLPFLERMVGGGAHWCPVRVERSDAAQGVVHRHPVHRFGEPRFAEARSALGAERCVSCRGEHDGGRVTTGSVGFCVECHADTEVSDDPAEPSHAVLVAEERWSAHPSAGVLLRSRHRTSHGDVPGRRGRGPLRDLPRPGAATSRRRRPSRIRP